MNEEEEVEDKEEVKCEDEEEDSKHETMPDEDADEAHPDSTEAGADEADEPLSDSDAEPEAEPDHKQKKGKKKLTEEHDKAPRPPARSAAAMSTTQHLQNLHWPVNACSILQQFSTASMPISTLTQMLHVQSNIP